MTKYEKRHVETIELLKKVIELVNHRDNHPHVDHESSIIEAAENLIEYYGIE